MNYITTKEEAAEVIRSVRTRLLGLYGVPQSTLDELAAGIEVCEGRKDPRDRRRRLMDRRRPNGYERRGTAYKA